MIKQFMYGAVMMASLANGLFFLKFWKKTGDRFFSMFAAAFILMAIERWLFLFIPTANETNSWIFVCRLVAFILITMAVIDKNRK